MYAIEVYLGDVPTELYERLFNKFGEEVANNEVPEGERTTQVSIVCAVYRNTINWYIVGEKDLDSQGFRDKIYKAGADAHKEVNDGCSNYYRGTNSYHTKTLHSAVFEAMYNHNHYTIGRPNELEDTLDLRPEDFESHLNAFLKSKNNEGYLNENTAKAMVAGYSKWFYRTHVKEEVSVVANPNRKIDIWVYDRDLEKERSAGREFTSEDEKEHAEAAEKVGDCDVPERGLEDRIRGYGAENADDRQAGGTSIYVLRARMRGEARMQRVEDRVEEIQLGLVKGAKKTARENELKSLIDSGNNIERKSRLQYLVDCEKVLSGFEASSNPRIAPDKVTAAIEQKKVLEKMDEKIKAFEGTLYIGSMGANLLRKPGVRFQKEFMELFKKAELLECNKSEMGDAEKFAIKYEFSSEKQR